MKISKKIDLDKIPELKIGDDKEKRNFNLWAYWWDFSFKFGATWKIIFPWHKGNMIKEDKDE